LIIGLSEFESLPFLDGAGAEAIIPAADSENRHAIVRSLDFRTIQSDSATRQDFVLALAVVCGALRLIEGD
jgi:hypothetical protein